MFSHKRFVRQFVAVFIGLLAAAGLNALEIKGALETKGAQEIKIADPASVVVIVNRDSNDISFMDIKTHKIVGSVFLGNNVNPHMAMMSSDGRWVVTGGTRANKAYICPRAFGLFPRWPLLLSGQPRW